MKVDDFTAAAPGRLVQASGVGGEHLAFIPNPLPPRFDLDQDLARAISEADRAGRIGVGAFLKAVEHLFEQPYVDAPALEDRLGVSHPTALKILKKMTHLGFIAEVTGRARAQPFPCRCILHLLK